MGSKGESILSPGENQQNFSRSPNSTDVAGIVSTTPSTMVESSGISPSADISRGRDSNMDTDNAWNNAERSKRATSVLSMDDIEAAQALEGLRTGKHTIRFF